MLRILTIKVRVTPQRLSTVASRSLSHVGRYDWVFFTSKNAVIFFSEEMRKRRITLPDSILVAAVGPETARALRRAGYPVHVVPKPYTVSEMINGIGTVRGSRILFPRSVIAPQEVIQTLRARGARVRVVRLYTTEVVCLSRGTKRALLRGAYSAVFFRSPSGVYGLMKQLTDTEKEVVGKIRARCIGPTTAQAAKAAGFKDVLIRGVS